MGCCENKKIVEKEALGYKMEVCENCYTIHNYERKTSKDEFLTEKDKKKKEIKCPKCGFKWHE